MLLPLHRGRMFREYNVADLSSPPQWIGWPTPDREDSENDDDTPDAPVAPPTPPRWHGISADAVMLDDSVLWTELGLTDAPEPSED